MNEEPKMFLPDEQRFPFFADLVRRWKKWTNLENDDIVEALRDLTGDTYLEMRKLTSIVLSQIEAEIACGRYKGFVRGRELSEKERAESRAVIDEDLKRALREHIELAWKSILDKQKVGAEKLAIALKPYLIKSYDNKASKVQETSVRSSGDE